MTWMTLDMDCGKNYFANPYSIKSIITLKSIKFIKNIKNY